MRDPPSVAKLKQIHHAELDFQGDSRIHLSKQVFKVKFKYGVVQKKDLREPKHMHDTKELS